MKIFAIFSYLQFFRVSRIKWSSSRPLALAMLLIQFDIKFVRLGDSVKYQTGNPGWFNSIIYWQCKDGTDYNLIHLIFLFVYMKKNAWCLRRLSNLEHIDVEVDWGVEGSQRMRDACDVFDPNWPWYLLLK